MDFPLIDISYEGNCIILGFDYWLLQLSINISIFVTSLANISLFSYVWMILHFMDVPRFKIYLSVYEEWICIYRLAIVKLLLQAIVYSIFVKNVLLFLLCCRYLDIEFLHYWRTLWLAFWGTTKGFSRVHRWFYIPISNLGKSYVYPIRYQLLFYYYFIVFLEVFGQ